MMNIRRIGLTYTGLPRSVYIIFFARIVNSIGNFVFPFMTLLLTDKVGMTEEKVGVYLLMAAILQIPGSLLGGKLTDVMGRKKIMVFFMGLSACCTLPCAFLIGNSTTIQYVPWLLIGTSLFRSIANPANGAMMNDLTQPDNRQAAFSLLYLGMNAGTAIGSIVAGFLFNSYMKLLFIGDAIATLLSITLLIVFVKETIPTKEIISRIERERESEKAETGGLLAALIRRPLLLTFAVLNTIYSFVYAQTGFSLPLKANLVFGSEQGAKFYGTFNMVNCLVVIFLTTFITMLTKRIRSIYNVAIAGVFYAIGFGMLYLVNGFWLFMFSTIIWTIGEIVSATNVGVFIANHTPASHRGRFQSMIHIITSTGSSISPYLMGSFIASYGVNNVWPITFLLSIIAAFFMYLLGTYEKKHQKNTYVADEI